MAYLIKRINGGGMPADFSAWMRYPALISMLRDDEFTKVEQWDGIKIALIRAMHNNYSAFGFGYSLRNVLSDDNALPNCPTKASMSITDKTITNKVHS